MVHSTTVTQGSWHRILAIGFTISMAGCGGGGGGGGDVTVPAPPASPPADTIPLNSQYEITLAGSTSPGGAVSLVADLVVLPTVATSAPSGNGVNAVELGIFTRAQPTAGNIGALSFGTNTSLAGQPGSGNMGANSVDLAFVDAKQDAGTVDITVDGKALGLPNARIATFNVYNVASGAATQVNSILSGLVNVRFSNGGQNVAGDITLTGFGGPGLATSYQATFTGIRVK